MNLEGNNGLNNSDHDCISTHQIESLAYSLSYLTLIASCLSIFGSSLIILTFILWKDVRQSVARIILLFLALADLGTGLGYLVSSTGHILIYHEKDENRETGNNNFTFDSEKFCTGTSFLNTYFPVCSFFWTGFLAIYFVMALVLKRTQWTRALLVTFNIIAWLVPLVICVVAVSFGVLGGSRERTSADWCFVAINGTNPKYHYGYTAYLLFEAVCGKGWEIMFYIVVIISYSVIFCVNRKWCRLKRTNRTSRYIKDKYNPPPSSLQTESGTDYVRISLTASNQVLSQAISKIDWKLLLIPCVFVLLRLPGTYRYFLSFANVCHRHADNSSCSLTRECYYLGGNYQVIYLQALCDPLQGFGNAILFVFLSKTIMRRLTHSLYSCLSRCLCCYCCSRQSSSSLWASLSGKYRGDYKSAPREDEIKAERSSSFSVRYSPIDSRETDDTNKLDTSIGSVQFQYGATDNTK